MDQPIRRTPAFDPKLTNIVPSLNYEYHCLLLCALTSLLMVPLKRRQVLLYYLRLL